MLTQSNKETKGKVVKLTPLFLGMCHSLLPLWTRL